ncbi:hypothetical protein [Actinomycetospora sp. CA-084318]|uniref:hypothetical protein n=1 Tax=Actinomycetospora sp. CA-084318 TaxID=3239892 RepID=UPI003D979B6D
MNQPERGLDPEMLRTLVDAHHDTASALRWVSAAWDLEQDGTLTYPLRSLDDLDHVFALAQGGGLSNADVRTIKSCIPAAVFPVDDFRDFVHKTLVVVQVVHRLQDPKRPPKKWRQ